MKPTCFSCSEPVSITDEECPSCGIPEPLDVIGREEYVPPPKEEEE